MKIENIPLDRIDRSETNPRKRFPREKIADLVESIRKSGLIQPITVRPVGDRFEIVAGECRSRALGALGEATAACVVRDLDDREVAVIQMAENLARHELNTMEQSYGVSRMVELGMTPEEISDSIGFGKRWVQARLSLGELPKAAQKALEDDHLTIVAAEEILKVDEEDREDAVQDLLQFGEELTTAHVLDRLNERYLVPKMQRAEWRRWCAEVAADWVGLATFLEDPLDWVSYAHPYGRTLGKWKLAADVIGSAAARESDAVITWGDLAKSLGVPGLLVPVGGVVNEIFDNVRLLVDGGMIAAAEKAARKAKMPYTLGPRKASVEAVEDEGEEESHAEQQSSGGMMEAGPVGSRIPELRAAGWSPWVAMSALEEAGGQCMDRVSIALDILSMMVPEWETEVCEYLSSTMAAMDEVVEEFGSRRALAVWWILLGDVSDVRLVQIASRFGILKVWREGRAS